MSCTKRHEEMLHFFTSFICLYRGMFAKKDTCICTRFCSRCAVSFVEHFNFDRDSGKMNKVKTVRAKKTCDIN